MDALRLAVGLNPKLRRLLVKDKEWDSLRQREDFKKLLMK